MALPSKYAIGYMQAAVCSRHREISNWSLGFKHAVLNSQALASTKCDGIIFVKDKAVCSLIDKCVQFSNQQPRMHKTVAVYDRLEISLVFIMLSFFCEMRGLSLPNFKIPNAE